MLENQGLWGYKRQDAQIHIVQCDELMYFFERIMCFSTKNALQTSFERSIMLSSTTNLYWCNILL